MKISELAGLLAKVQNIAGDVDVVLKDAASEVETVITDFVMHLSPSDGSVTGGVSIEHGPAPAAPPPASADTTPDDSAPPE